MKKQFFIYTLLASRLLYGADTKEPQVDARTNSINKTLNKIEERMDILERNFSHLSDLMESRFQKIHEQLARLSTQSRREELSLKDLLRDKQLPIDKKISLYSHKHPITTLGDLPPEITRLSFYDYTELPTITSKIKNITCSPGLYPTVLTPTTFTIFPDNLTILDIRPNMIKPGTFTNAHDLEYIGLSFKHNVTQDEKTRIIQELLTANPEILFDLDSETKLQFPDLNYYSRG